MAQPLKRQIFLSVSILTILVYLVLWVVMPAPGAEPRGFNVRDADDV